LVLEVLERHQQLQVQIPYLAALQVMAVATAGLAQLRLMVHLAVREVAVLALAILLPLELAVLVHQDKVVLAAQVKIHPLILAVAAGGLLELVMMALAAATEVAVLLLA
jgi:hypothetical protein